MEKKLTELLLILGGLALTAFAAVKLLSGGFYDMIWFMVCLIPFVLALFLGFRNWWPLLVIISPALPLPKASMVLLDRFTPEMIFNMALIGFLVGQICINRRGVSLSTKYARPMLVLAVMITGRLLMDPPGSGRVGATGGLGAALSYLIAGWGFFAIWWAVTQSGCSDDKLVKGFLIISILLYGLQLIRGNALYELYHRRSWLMWPFVLGWIAFRQGAQKGRWGLFHFLSLCIMGFGLISPHRKTIVMTGLTCMAVAWIFHVEKRQMKVLAMAGVLSLGLVLGTGNVPNSMKRALSTILPAQFLGLEESQMGHYGLHDDWRSAILYFAMQDIVQHPLIGQGFSWSTADAVALLASQQRAGLRGRSELAAIVGNMHYGFMDLMKNIGAIIPWFYAYAGLGILYRFMKMGRDMPDGYSKVMAAGIAGYFINNLFQWLFNGAAAQMLTLTIALGLMMGLMERWRSLQKTEMISDELLVDEAG